MVGLGNVNNTSDANKPISIATATALSAKVDKYTDSSHSNATALANDVIAPITGSAFNGGNSVLCAGKLQVASSLTAQQAFNVVGISAFGGATTHSDDVTVVAGKVLNTDSLKCVTNTGTSTGVLTVSDNMTIATGKNLVVGGNLTVSGTLSVSGLLGQIYHCVGFVSGPGTPQYTAGATTYTVAHTAGTGIYTITFGTAHSKSSYYPIIVTPNTGSTVFCVAQASSSTVMTVKMFTNAGAAIDAGFTFQVMA